MYNGLLHLHNFGRWVLLLLLVLAIFRHLTGITGNKAFTSSDKKVDLFLMITAHLMLLVGLYQWVAGPLGLKNIMHVGFGEVMQNKQFRFWAVEHFAGMLIAIVFITIGRGVAKKNISDVAKHKKAFWFFVIALFIILAMVPWPFREGIGRPLLPGMH
jgi:hypothetical protein